VFGGLLVFVLGIVGCGGASAESLVKDRIKAMNDLGDAYKANDADKIKGLEKKIEDLDGQLSKVKDDAVKAVKNNEKDWEKAATHLGAESKGKAPEKIIAPSWAK
jgi:hypothetical protein